MSKTEKVIINVVDLVRNKPKGAIEIAPTPIKVSIEFKSRSKLAKRYNTELEKRLRSAGMMELVKIEKALVKDVTDANAKIAPLIGVPTAKALAKRKVETALGQKKVRETLNAAEEQIKTAILAVLQKEKDGRALLKEAKIKTALTVSKNVISLSAATAKLVTSSGAALTAYVKAYKAGMGIYKEFKKWFASEPKRRKALEDALADYIRNRHRGLAEAAAKEGLQYDRAMQGMTTAAAITALAGLTDNPDPIEKALDAACNAVQKSGAAKVEAARKDYFKLVTTCCNKVDALGLHADKVFATVKNSASIKDGVELAQKWLELRRKVNDMSAQLNARSTFLQTLETQITENGLTIDDRTVLRKLQELKPLDIYKAVKEVEASIQDVESVVKTVAKIAA